MKEHWKSVPGHEGCYEVSDQGRMRSWMRAPVGRLTVPKILSPYMGEDKKYAQVWLPKKGFKRKRAYLHRLILEAFVGECPKGQQGAHLNGDSHDCRLSNLAWVTPSENAAHKRQHGTLLSGEQIVTSKLTWTQVLEIRVSKTSGVALAKKFKVSCATISHIRTGKVWKSPLSKL